jgi:nucleotide-binding universal stress UspA family protein
MKKLSIRNILVPTDFSKMSLQVIEPAKWLAGRFAASIHLVHVHESDYPAGFVAPAPPFSVTPYEQEAKERVAGELNALAHKYGVPAARCHVLSGAPAFNEICGLAGEIRADLIVMPTHGRTGLEHMFLGSTAERIVRHSPCPVFVMRQRGKNLSEKKAGYKKILVPVDFSDCSREGLRYAIAFAGRFGAKLIVLHVIRLPYAYISDLYGIYQPSLLAGEARKGAARRMQKLLQTMEFGDVKLQTAITTGTPTQEICSFSAKKDVNLIITSTHGLSGLKHVSTGSIAEQVVRHASCPVLVVPSHPKVRMAKLPKRRRRKTRAMASPRRQRRKLLRRATFTTHERAPA